MPYWCSCCTDVDAVASVDERSIKEVTALHLGTLPHAPLGGTWLSITQVPLCFVLTHLNLFKINHLSNTPSLIFPVFVLSQVSNSYSPKSYIFSEILIKSHLLRYNQNLTQTLYFRDRAYDSPYPNPIVPNR